ncbi:MAG: hypothetical protein V8Q79_10865 [Christensenellales bacterium]
METVGDLVDEEKKDMVWHFVIMMRFRASRQIRNQMMQSGKDEENAKSQVDE